MMTRVIIVSLTTLYQVLGENRAIGLIPYEIFHHKGFGIIYCEGIYQVYHSNANLNQIQERLYKIRVNKILNWTRFT